MPEAGGWNDQPADLVQKDWKYLSRAYTFYMEDLRETDTDDAGADSMAVFIHQMTQKQTVNSWSDLTRD